MTDTYIAKLTPGPSFLDRLEDPNAFSNIVGGLLGVLEAFGTHASGPGQAIAVLAYSLLGLIHPAPHTIPLPGAVADTGMAPHPAPPA